MVKNTYNTSRRGSFIDGVGKTLGLLAAAGIVTVSAFYGSGKIESPVTKYNGFDLHEVRSGDTYWGVAGDLRGNCSDLERTDIRDIVSELRRINEDAPLMPGEDIAVPRYCAGE